MLDKSQASPWLGPLRSAAAGPILLIARILMGYIFVLSGWGKLMGLAGFTARMQEQGIPYGLAVVGPIVEFFGGLALVLGVATPCSGAHRVHISGHRHRASVLGVRRASASGTGDQL